MLSELCDVSLIQLKIKANDWQDAIQKAAQPLINEEKILPGYIKEILKTVNETGPYFVITKHVALPHARPEAGALQNAIGITTLDDAIIFHHEQNDPVKYIFCLSAKDNQRHLQALSELVGLLEDENFFKLLDTTSNPEEVMKYIKQKEIECKKVK